MEAVTRLRPFGVVDRERELGAVADFLDALAARPAVLLLEGDAGIGKTTLWQAAVDQARRRRFRVLTARPAAAETQLAYASLADLLAPVENAVLKALPEPQRRALDAVLLRDATAVATDRRAIGAALLSVLERLAAAAPVLLAIDDLQWVDSSSAAAIEFATRRLSARVGLLAALRSAEPGPSPGPLQLDTTRHVRVGPLDRKIVHSMLRERLGRSFPRPVLERIHQISGGNPFHALELARGVGTDGEAEGQVPLPASLAHLVRDRIDGVPAGVRQVLLAAATLAEPTVGLLQLAASADPAEGERLLELAETGGLLRVDGRRVQPIPCWPRASTPTRRRRNGAQCTAGSPRS